MSIKVLINPEMEFYKTTILTEIGICEFFLVNLMFII